MSPESPPQGKGSKPRHGKKYQINYDSINWSKEIGLTKYINNGFKFYPFNSGSGYYIIHESFKEFSDFNGDELQISIAGANMEEVLFKINELGEAGLLALLEKEREYYG